MWLVYGAVVSLGFYLFRRWLKGAPFDEPVSAVGKVALVTGANTGIGLQTARELSMRGAKVYMLCRSESRANEGRNKIIKDGCDPSRLIFVRCDLSRFASIRAAVKKIQEAEDHLDILVNNAAIMFYPHFELTEDGHEITWQSNHLGPFLLTELLLPLLEKSEDGRIVNVSALLHKALKSKINLDTVDEKESFSGFQAYNRSKLANVQHARELTRRLRERGVHNLSINSCHPGVVATELSRHLFLVNIPGVLPLSHLFMKTDWDGAQTSLFLSLSSKVKGVSGCYFSDCREEKMSDVAMDDEACRELYEYSLREVGL